MTTLIYLCADRSYKSYRSTFQNLKDVYAWLKLRFLMKIKHANV